MLELLIVPCAPAITFRPRQLQALQLSLWMFLAEKG